MTCDPSNSGPHLDQAHPLPSNEPSRFHWLVGGLWVAIFLISRLTNLMVLPIFTDEGMHISRAQEMLETGNFIRGTLAGKFLHIWLLALIIPWFQAPLVTARVLSVATGLASGIATIYLAYTLWPHRDLGWIAALIYLFIPLPLINERMALSDSLLTVLTTLILILSIKFIRQPRNIAGYALGVCLGLAYLTKINGLIYFTTPILAFVFLREGEQSAKILIRPYLIALLVALPTALEFPRQFLSVAVRSVLNPIGPQVSPGNWQLYGLGETWLDLTAYVTWPILLLAAMRLLYGLRSRGRISALFAVLLLITPSFYILSAKDVWYSRYLLPIVPLLVVLAARTLVDLASLLNRNTRSAYGKVWLVSLSLLALLPSLAFDYQFITDPRYAPLTPVDRWQYITGWPSGYGLAETVTWLRQRAAEEGPLVVIADLHSGPTQEGVSLYLGNGTPDIRFLSVDLRSVSPESLQQLVQIQTMPTLLLLNKPADRDLNPSSSPCPTVLAVFPKPENHSQMVLKDCTATTP